MEDRITGNYLIVSDKVTLHLDKHFLSVGRERGVNVDGMSEAQIKKLRAKVAKEVAVDITNQMAVYFEQYVSGE